MLSKTLLLERMVPIIFLMLVLNHGCFSVNMGRFISTTPPNLDILDLYYDFLLSNLSSVDPPMLVDKVFSRTQCSLLCLGNTKFRCNGFSYSPEKQSCILMSMLNSKNRSNSSYSFKRIPDCPSNFIYLPSFNKCYSWVVGKWIWVDARKKCNEIRSHPLVTENLKEFDAVNAFSSLSFGDAKIDYSMCLVGNTLTWTSANMIKPNKMPFVWKPFQMKDGSEPYLPISFINWGAGQPDNSGSAEFCTELTHSFIFNDLGCGSLRCAICEIDV